MKKGIEIERHISDKHGINHVDNKNDLNVNCFSYFFCCPSLFSLSLFFSWFLPFLIFLSRTYKIFR